MRADLDADVDAWMARRSSRFRQRLGQIERRASAAGVEVVDGSALGADVLLSRALTVERSSWKGEEETGLSDPELVAFYRRMLERLEEPGGCRALFARREDTDVGYVLGGVRVGTYRGFQLSQTRAVEHLSVGHLLQLHQVRQAAAEGVATYDLGMAMPYKLRWGDRVDTTFALAVRR